MEKKTLPDIKKRLGFERKEAYTVFRFPLKQRAVNAASVTHHPSYLQSMSAILPSTPSDGRPRPSPKPRRIPPKPPTPYSVAAGTTTVTTPPIVSPPPVDDDTKIKPVIKPVIKPKPKSFPTSKSQSFQLSPSPEHSSSGRNPSSSSEENLLTTISNRPRLNTPKLQDSNNVPRRPMTPEGTSSTSSRTSLEIDDQGMATVRSNYRPTDYCTVELDYEEDNKPLVINNTLSLKNEYTEINVIEPITPSHTSTNEYDVTSHNTRNDNRSHPPLQGRYSTFDRPDKPNNPIPAHSSRILPYYDEIEIDSTQKRPVLVTQTTGYSTLGSSTDTERVQSSIVTPPTKPPRPNIPPKPSVTRKSNESSRESSPFSPNVSPAHKLQNAISPSNKRDSGTDSDANKFDNHCIIDIDAMIARARNGNIKIPDDDNEQDTIDGSIVQYDDSMVKISDVINESLLPKERNDAMIHMYETLPWDDDKVDTVQEKTDTKRRKPPPPPVGVHKGSPILPHVDKTDDSTKTMSLGRKPKHLKVTPTKSLDDKEIVDSKTGDNYTLSKVKKNSTSESPVAKSKFKFKNFIRSSTKDENSRSSTKKNNRKSSHQSSAANFKTKCSTLPSRPRGKSLDPFMSTDIYSTIPDDFGYGRDEKSPSPQPQAFAYSIIDAKEVKFRSKTLNTDTSPSLNKGFRKSQSVEHLYEMAKWNQQSSSLGNECSPIACDDFNITMTTYDTIDNEPFVDKKREQEESDNELLTEPPLSPVRDVTHVTVGGDRLYAVVTKQPKNEIKKQEEPNEIRNFSPPPPLPPYLPSRSLPKQPPPPKPAPYKPTSDETENKIVTTKTTDKYAHFLNSPPPNRPPPNRPLPIPNESSPRQTNTDMSSDSLPKKLMFDPPINKPHRPHMYDTVAFDEGELVIKSPNNMSQSVPSPKFIHGKVRPLKPKDKSAPPPPLQESPGTTPISDGNNFPFLFKSERLDTFIEAGNQSRLSTSTSDGTISTVETGYYDSNSSSDFDPSTDEDDEYEPKRLIKVQRSKTYYIAEEILTTERSFVRGLTLLHKDFRAHMLSANNAHDKVVVTEETLSIILSSNLGGIYQLNWELLKELEERLKNWDTKPKLGDIFVRRAPFLKLYSPYISNFDKALKTLEEHCKRNPLFAQVVKEFEIEPKCNNLTVAAYLLETVQRIPRYKLLLADYIKYLPQGSDDREDSEKAFSIIASVASHVNETIKQIENFRKTIEVSKKLIGDVGDSLISPSRKLLKEGELIKSSRKEKQTRMFFLFTDLLVYAAAIPPANTTFRAIKRIPIEGMRVQFLDDPEMKYSFQIISTCKSFRLEANSNDDREQWMKAFNGAIKDHFNRKQSRQLHRRSMQVDFTDDSEGTLGLFAPPWLPDSSVSMCQLCGIHFTVTRRRHHCRACGMIFCSDCSSYIVPLPYKNNKPSRVCQTCCTTIMDGDDTCSSSDQISKPSSLKARPGRLSQQKKISMPSVLREVRARDESAQISGYLYHRKDKSRQWKKKWFMVYNLVMYEFKRHEDVTAQQSIPLPSYTVSTEIQGLNDPLLFSLEHTGAGRILFKADDEEQLASWVSILQKAVKGELDLS